MPKAIDLISLDAIQKVRLTGKRAAGAVPVTLDAAAKPGQRTDALDKGKRTLVIGCGKREGDARVYWEGVGGLVVQALQAAGVATAALAEALPDDALEPFATGALLAGYDNQLYRKTPAKTALKPVTLQLPGAKAAALAAAAAVAESVNWARALVDAPPNFLNPQSFAREAQSLKTLGVTVEVLDDKALAKLGAHGLLAVGRSSPHKPCMVVARWNGRSGKDTDLAIVGKGLTFDGGGLNLKMAIIEKMKFDMGGAAAAIGALRLLAASKAKANVTVVLVLCENIIGGDAYRPGDVIGSLEGLTIEVANTDAEGRIVVADGISYAKRFKPKFVVDIATLTGSSAATFHSEFAAMFSGDEELALAIEASAKDTGDLVWRMPLSPLQDYIVESDIADVRNLGGMTGVGVSAAGSSIAGAKFLEKFAKGARWAHLDMASTVLIGRPRGPLRPGATGWGVRLLADLARRV